jgi:hypothetical protein
MIIRFNAKNVFTKEIPKLIKKMKMFRVPINIATGNDNTITMIGKSKL